MFVATLRYCHSDLLTYDMLGSNISTECDYRGIGFDADKTKQYSILRIEMARIFDVFWAC